MVAIVDTPLSELLRSVEGTGIDFDSFPLILIEAELSDPEGGDSHPDPLRGLNIALAYVSRGKPVIIVGEKEYGSFEVWSKLFSNHNVAFCPKPITSECFREALKKIMPGEGI
ncbi:MAG: hypothetical protein PHQ42_00835 [Patescibacteria group bacterium]|nr:hypothetical protein [Patescibacteria group bacterium]